MKDTNLKGTITELKCQTHFLELGYNVSVPQNPDRYDFILDTGNKLLKIQVKTCNNNNPDYLVFATCSSHYVHGKHVHTAYQNEGIDYFCTYFDNQCYLVPVSECGKKEKRMRLVPTNNGQTANICFAANYIAKDVLMKQIRD